MKYGVLIYQDKTDLDKFIIKEKNRKNNNNIDLLLLIEEICNNIRNKGIKNFKTQITRDGLLGGLRKIDFIYKNLQKFNNLDEKEIFLVGFFHYYKSLLEIIKKNFKIIKIDKELFNEITEIRNFFAHSYEKDYFFGKKVFIRLDLNNSNGIIYKDKNGMNNIYSGLDRLEIFNFENSEKIAEQYFSTSLFYYKLIEYIYYLNDNL